MATRRLAIYILYGIPCVGKSTAAIQLAYHRGIRTVIHTDYIREIQRSYTSTEQAPALAKVTHNAWELYGPPTPENVVAGFTSHLADVAIGIRIAVRKLVSDGFNAVIEGAHFHSAIIEELRNTHPCADIQPTLLVVRTVEELRRRAAVKESCRAQGAERKQWQENLSAMLTIQDYLIADANGHGIRIVSGD